MPNIDYIRNYLRKYNIPINGVIHVGAHKCEELPHYEYANISRDKIIWVEANSNLVIENLRNHNNIKIFNYCVSDQDDLDVEYKITNNSQSSSILDLDIHEKNYPDVFL